MMRTLCALGAFALLWSLLGCGSDPPSTVGDNPAAANGKKPDEVLTKEQQEKRARAMPKGNPW